MICRLERLIDYFVRPGPLSSQTLGRSGEKFSQLFAAAQELPIGEVDLLELVSCIYPKILILIRRSAVSLQCSQNLGGSMRDRERVSYRRPFPRSSFMEWLSIDDHIGIQVVSK